jgi:hypothetical protein
MHRAYYFFYTTLLIVGPTGILFTAVQYYIDTAKLEVQFSEMNSQRRSEGGGRPGRYSGGAPKKEKKKTEKRRKEEKGKEKREKEEDERKTL